MEHFQDLLRELECPLCCKYMMAPILICEKGHNICSYCKPRFTTCPTCKSKFLEARNVSLENLARNLKVPCSNAKWGCGTSFTADVIREHEKDCEFSPFKCPFNEKSCAWSGLLDDMKKHVRESHPEKVFESDRPMFWYGKFLESKEDCSGVILAHGEVFKWSLGRTESYISLLHGFVKHIGLKKNSPKYKYELTLKKHDDVESMCVCHKVHSFDKIKEEILSSRKCLKVEYSTVKLFLDENKCILLSILISEL